MRERSERYDLAWFDVEASSRRERTRGGGDAPVRRGEGRRGVRRRSVDAIFSAIQAAVDVECELRQYTVSAVTEGEDALGEVTVMLRAGGRLASGQGVSTDILEASAGLHPRALERSRGRRGARGGGAHRGSRVPALTGP